MKLFKTILILVHISIILISCVGGDCENPPKLAEVKFDSSNLSYFNYKYNSVLKCRFNNKDTISLYATDTAVGTYTFTDKPMNDCTPRITYTNDVKSLNFFTSQNEFIISASYALINESNFQIRFNIYYSGPAGTTSIFNITPNMRLDTVVINNKTYTDIIMHENNANKVVYSIKFGVLQVIKDEAEVFSLL